VPCARAGDSTVATANAARSLPSLHAASGSVDASRQNRQPQIAAYCVTYAAIVHLTKPRTVCGRVYALRSIGGSRQLLHARDRRSTNEQAYDSMARSWRDYVSIDCHTLVRKVSQMRQLTESSEDPPPVFFICLKQMPRN